MNPSASLRYEAVGEWRNIKSQGRTGIFNHFYRHTAWAGAANIRGGFTIEFVPHERGYNIDRQNLQCVVTWW